MIKLKCIAEALVKCDLALANLQNKIARNEPQRRVSTPP